MSRKRIALSVLLVCALSLGGWLAFGPAWPSPARAEPSIDIEPPAGRARLEATLALARMPDEPWTLSEASPAVSAASDAQADGARCGEDQLAQFGPVVEDADGGVRELPRETKPAGVGYTGAMRRIDAALRSSGDPFDTAVADALNVDDMFTPAARLQALVQDAVSSDDARAYGLAFSICSNAPGIDGLSPETIATSCTRLDPRHWAAVDPGNGVPWLFALAQANKQGDHDAQHEALQNLASASRFDVRFDGAAAAVASLRLPSDADLAAQAELSMRAIPLGPLPPFQPLTLHCRDKAGGDAAMAATCETIATMLFDHSDALLARAIGGSIHKQLTGDASRLDQAHRESGAAGRRWAAEMVTTPCATERQVLKHMVRVGTVGEVAWMKEVLKESSPQ